MQPLQMQNFQSLSRSYLESSYHQDQDCIMDRLSKGLSSRVSSISLSSLTLEEAASAYQDNSNQSFCTGRLNAGTTRGWGSVTSRKASEDLRSLSSSCGEPPHPSKSCSSRMVSFSSTGSPSVAETVASKSAAMEVNHDEDIWGYFVDSDDQQQITNHGQFW